MTKHWFRDHPITVFLVLTFGLTWSIAATAILAADWFTAVFGGLNARAPMFYLAVWSPNIAAFVVTLMVSGWSGISDLFARLFRWRVRPWVWIAALGFFPVLMLIAELIGLALGDPLPTTANWTALAAGMVTLPLLALGPLGEELGWRGFLLPRLLDRVQPLTAALILGPVWMAWHLPAFFLSGMPQSNMSLFIFVLSGVSLNVFITWLFLNARHSILIAGIIPHASANAWAESMGSITWINAGVLVGGAVLLVWLVGLREVGAAQDQQKVARST